MNSDFLAWFSQLDRLLADCRDWWQVRAFWQRDYPWGGRCPELAQALDNLPDTKLEALERDPLARADWLRRWIPEVDELQRLARLARLPERPQSPSGRLHTGVPGNKWQQIEAFVGRLEHGRWPTLEWCAGKGHLGRRLAHAQGCPVTSVEYNADLCDAGRHLAARHRLEQSFTRLDVMQAGASGLLRTHPRVLALHACGDLHRRLLQLWIEAGGERLALAPCCYHLQAGELYQPMSQAATGAALTLERADLSLPLQEVVTGGSAARRRRERELHWRLAFDEWQRRQRGLDRYLPLPGLRRAQLGGSFEAFMCWAATSKGLPPPTFAAQREAHAAAERRVARVRRLELVSHLFRRPLEVWLLLDRVLCLQEAGAEVTLGEFCDYRLTPRNALIQARR